MSSLCSFVSSLIFQTQNCKNIQKVHVLALALKKENTVAELLAHHLRATHFWAHYKFRDRKTICWWKDRGKEWLLKDRDSILGSHGHDY